MVVLDNDSNTPRLVGYVVTCGIALEPGDLRAHLKARLPEYMVPAAFIVLRQWPLTSSGKVDRRALPRPEPTPSAADRQSLRTEMEQNVAHVWEQVLEMHPIGPDDNFFDLGGHSLTAVQITARLRNSLGLELPVRRIFEHPTIAELSAHIDLLHWAKQSSRGPEADTRSALVVETL